MVKPMANNSCLWYTEAQISIYFPEGKVCCDLCPLMETYSRKQCRKTGEYLADTRTIGYMCPLKFIENDLKYVDDKIREYWNMEEENA